MDDISWPPDHDREHDHEHEADCWCGPQRLVVAEGVVFIHYGPDGLYAPAEHVIAALEQMVIEGQVRRLLGGLGPLRGDTPPGGGHGPLRGDT